MKQEYKISKDLFEAVFGVKIMVLSIVGRRNSKFIQYAYGYTGVHTLSVNDFFFICKDWVLRSHSIINSSALCIPDINDGKPFYQCQIYKDSREKSFNSDSEQQAVFDACEWIINNGDKIK
jgi:hypothetical protein